jgi:hypothetical protein
MTKIGVNFPLICGKVDLLRFIEMQLSLGVFNPKSCGSSTTDLNHAMLVVGYGRDATYGDYWIVKNSWGSSWGNSGKFSIDMNKLFSCFSMLDLISSISSPRIRHIHK